MIKPASSGDLRITTGFFLFSLPPSFSLVLSFPARGRYNYWGHKSSCAAAESQPFGGWSSCVTNRRGGKKRERKNICKHVYLNVNGLPVMRAEIISKKKQLGEAAYDLRLKVGFNQRSHNPRESRDVGSVLQRLRARKPTVNRQHRYNRLPTHAPPNPTLPWDRWPSMIGT